VRAFQSNFEDDGYVVFVISSKSSSKRLKRLVGFSNGVIKRISYDSLSVDHVFKVPMMGGEKLTCGFYSDNDFNFVFGTNYGTVFFATLRAQGKNRVEASYCRIDNVCKQNVLREKQNESHQRLNIDLDGGVNESENLSDFEKTNSQNDEEYFVGVTSIHFPYADPIGTMLVAFDDGTIKVWQSTVKNEQYMKILELQQAGSRKLAGAPVVYDIAEVGYQQFDLIDNFDIFENPHDQDLNELDRQQLKSLYTVSLTNSFLTLFANRARNTPTVTPLSRPATTYQTSTSPSSMLSSSYSSETSKRVRS
jgi:hypothetical protein